MSTNYRLLDIKYLIFHKIWLKLKARIHGNGVSVFYVKWSNNFGDLLTPIILKHYGFTPYFEYPKKAKAAVVGTILSIVSDKFDGYVLGSGWDKDKSCTFPNAKFLGVRGLLTKERLHLNDTVTIGDPGLLISEIVKFDLRKKKFKLGIIPHESEIDNPFIKKLEKKLPKSDATIINPRNVNAESVLQQICECENIVSSSLHGLIVSDSYGIPNGRIKITEIDSSNDFKFRDYYTSLEKPLETYFISGNEDIDQLISICKKPCTDIIETRKRELNQMFVNFKKEITL